METILVIVTKNNLVEEVIAHYIYEEQLSSDVVQDAEKTFAEKVKEYCNVSQYTEEELEEEVNGALEEGVWAEMGVAITLTWI
jgi:hypothetical protein